MLDFVIRGGTLIDGTGAPGRRADIGVRAGRIAAIGEIDEPAGAEVDATGLVVAPGFVDPHTHYDAQLFWDPLALPSSAHGVTTVLGGNCGFTLAPLKSSDADYTRRMMAKVEGMPLAALEQGVPWGWESFGDYLGRFEGTIGVNAGFLVGHCALRRYVMGEDAVGRQATAEEVDAMVQLLHRSIEAGGLGLSTTRSSTHNDGDSQPVASRWASVDELLTLCAAVSEHEGTTLEAIVPGCLDRFSDEEIDLLAAMSAAARRPLNWNVLGVDSRDREKLERQLAASDHARAAGGRVVALTMPILVPMTMSFLTFCALWLIPGWNDVLNVDVPERIRRLKDPEVRARMSELAAASSFPFLAQFGNYVIGDTYAPENTPLQGRRVDEIARERGQDPFTTIVDIAAADDLRTVLWPQPSSDSDADWALRAKVWEHPDVLLGGSDAGAHLDRMCGSPYSTRFLAEGVRERGLVPIEEAVRLITDAPARLFGLRDRGRVAEGYHADLVLFDPGTIGAKAPTIVPDLPGSSPRLVSEAVGIARVYVNGVETIVDGKPTGATAGTLLKAGRDTETVDTLKPSQSDTARSAS
jgi:N-acyl-D-aspartate/D-glutamate deacylase